MTEGNKPRLIGINHVAIEVGNIDEALEWYRRIFDFSLRGKGERNAFIDMGDQFVNMTLVPDYAVNGVEKRHLGFVVDDRSHIIELAKAAGARFVEGPFLDFLDPWGNRLEIIEVLEHPVHQGAKCDARHGPDARQERQGEERTRRQGHG